MATKTPRAVGLLIIAAALLGAFFLLWRPDGRPDIPPVATLEKNPTDSELTWRIGNSQRYRVAVESSFVMTMPGGSGQTMGLRIDGVLEQSTLAISSAGVMTGMRFSSLNLTIDGAADQGVNQALQSPFRTLFNKNGQPINFEFPAALAPEQRDILKNLVNMFQVILDEDDTWETTESNASGSYKARYVRKSNAEVSKQKLFYLPVGPTGSAPKVESTETIALDRNHDWLTQMTLDEVVTTNEVGSVPTRVTNHATIKLLPAPSQAATNTWDFAAVESDRLADSRANLPAISHQEARQRLAATLRELEQADEGRGELINRLRDLLLVDDLLPEVLLDTLRTEELTTRTRADLYLALELAGTPASQTALSTVLVDSNWPPQDAMRAIVALGAVSDPTENTLATLWDLARSNLAGTTRRDLPGTAALAIGSIGNNLRESEAVDYSALRSDLLASASSAIEPQERAVYLYALANTGDPDPLLKRDLVSYLDDPSSEVRSAAAKSLARLGSDEVETELLKRVKQEPSGQARASMIEALTTWENPPAEALEWTQQALWQEPDERARYNMAVLLGNNLDAYPENRRTLEQLLESEPSKRIRQKVANMLH
jgi:tetratricopeptide (TPR) repeat protein